MFSDLDRGCRYRFRYPSANYAGARQRMEQRRLLIEEVRSIEARPLEPQTINLDPLLRRGKTLVTGIDLDKMERRSFYLESMADIAYDDAPDDSQKHRVFIFDPSGEVPPYRAYSTDDVALALAWIGRWERDHQGHVAVLWPVGAQSPVAVKPREVAA